MPILSSVCICDYYLLIYFQGPEKGERGDEAKIIDEDDNPTQQQSNSSNKGWLLFAKVIDRLTFVAISIAYICMFIAFVP